MMRPYVGSWKRLAVQGAAAVLFGLATLVWPSITLWALVLLWGAFAFVDGVTALSAAIGDPLLVHRGWVAFWGVTGIVAGLVTFFWPSITALALLVVIATWSLLIGGSRIAFAISVRKQVSGAWSIALGGVVLVLLGMLLVISPGDGAIGITWAIGWFAFLFGSLELWLASVVRHETHELTRQTGLESHGPSTRRADIAAAAPARALPRRRPRAAAGAAFARRRLLGGRLMNRSAHRAPEPVHRTILVPLDGSHLADGALPTARALAARFGATIHTVTVTLSDFELERIRAEAAHALGTDPDDPRIHVEVDTDFAAAVHRCASQLESCLICLSTHGRGRIAGIVIGSTARDIIERSHEPVVVAGPSSSTRIPRPRRRYDHSVSTISSSASTGRPPPSSGCRSQQPGPTRSP